MSGRAFPALHELLRQGVRTVAGGAIGVGDVLRDDAVLVALRRRPLDRGPPVGAMAVLAALRHGARELARGARPRGIHLQRGAPLGFAERIGGLDDEPRRLRRLRCVRRRGCEREEHEGEQRPRLADEPRAHDGGHEREPVVPRLLADAPD